MFRNDSIKNQTSWATNLTVWIYDKTVADLIFIITASLISFFLISLMSFDPYDATAYSVAYPTFATRNLAGSVGAHLAGFFIYHFGVLAYFLPLPLSVYACRIVLKQNYHFKKTSVLAWAFIFTGCSWLIYSFEPYFHIKSFELASAGSLGHYFHAKSQELLGYSGSIVLVTALMLSGFTMLIQGSLLDHLIKYARYAFQFAKTQFYLGLSRVKVYFQKPEKKVQIAHSPALTKPKTPPSLFKKLVVPEEKVKTPVRPVVKRKRKASDDNYSIPPVELLKKSSKDQDPALRFEELEKTGELLVDTLSEFGVKGKIIAVKPGPVVTVFEFQPEAGIKQSKIVGLIEDLALALHVDSILIHPVVDKRALGIQVPNQQRKLVCLGDVIDTPSFQDSEALLNFAMGESLSGAPVSSDITTMPHLLIAGATGSGKSVAVNALLCSVLMKASPQDVKMILVDPKMLELSIYEGIPHLLMPVITEPQRAGATLKWAVLEMERRYKLMQLAQVRNIAGFNDFWENADEAQREELREEVQNYIKEDFEVGTLPLILIVIDELADLMLTAPKEIEALIQRLAQKARASGIHLVLATQRPSVDIITGVIKANLPCRTAFQVVSKHDSRTILDQMGAEKLLGKGDMLFQRPGVNRLERIQGAFVSDKEVIDLVQFIKTNSSTTDYDDKLIEWVDRNAQNEKDDYEADGDEDLDEKFDLALDIARQQGHISASFLQRQLKIGYNRAARIVESMERQGYVGAPEGSKPRQWIGES